MALGVGDGGRVGVALAVGETVGVALLLGAGVGGGGSAGTGEGVTGDCEMNEATGVPSVAGVGLAGAATGRGVGL